MVVDRELSSRCACNSGTCGTWQSADSAPSCRRKRFDGRGGVCDRKAMLRAASDGSPDLPSLVDPATHQLPDLGTKSGIGHAVTDRGSETHQQANEPPRCPGSTRSAPISASKRQIVVIRTCCSRCGPSRCGDGSWRAPEDVCLHEYGIAVALRHAGLSRRRMIVASFGSFLSHEFEHGLA